MASKKSKNLCLLLSHDIEHISIFNSTENVNDQYLSTFNQKSYK